MNAKTFIQITGLPWIAFAHIFSADRFENSLDPASYNPNTLEITYISEGELTCYLPDGTSFVLPSHTLLCNLFRTPLRVISTERHEHHTVGFLLPFTVVEESTPGALCLPLVIEHLEQSRVSTLIDEIIATHTMHTKGPLACTGLFLQLLDHLDRRTRETADAPSYNNRRYVKLTKEYIFAHLREPIRQSDIAAHLGISPEYLCAVFKKTEGMPVIQFINRIKLEQIRLLMENNHLTLAEASEIYGYSDPNYVSRLYKQYFRVNITEKKNRISNPLS